MRRIHFFEIHDQEWFPAPLRNIFTEGLQAVFDALNLYRPVAPLLRRALDDAGTNRVVDLCSGAGGPWPKLRAVCVREFGTVEISLTDKFPNAKARERLGKVEGSTIRFRPESVDALDVPEELTGFRTMFTSFHHFRPQEARAILRSAVARRQGIGIFEVPKRGVRTVATVFLVPFAYLALVPFLRPFRWSRMLWSYLIPVIPFTLWFDGLVSCGRAYTPAELKEMAAGLADGDYIWEAGEQPGSGLLPATVTYLIGLPAAGEVRAASAPAAEEGCAER